MQACGDAHLANFGGFAAPDRRLIFDINDFDETLPGPWEWDVKRLVASLEIAGRDREFGRKQRTLVAQSAATEYREQMRRLAKMGNLEAWYERVDLDLIREQFADAVEEEVIRELRQERRQGAPEDVGPGVLQAGPRGRRRSSRSSATHR